MFICIFIFHDNDAVRLLNWLLLLNIGKYNVLQACAYFSFFTFAQSKLNYCLSKSRKTRLSTRRFIQKAIITLFLFLFLFCILLTLGIVYGNYTGVGVLLSIH